MKKTAAILLMIALCLAMLPAQALAAKVEIKLGGKIGFLTEGGSVTLKPKLKNIASSALEWSSSDTSVLTVNNGTISAHSAGRAIVTVSGGGASARCGVVVLPEKLELNVGESFSLPYGTVERYTMQDKSVASISKKGVVQALKAGTTYLRVQYGKQKLYIQIQISGGTSMEQSAAAQLDCANSTNQIVLVEYESGSTARLSIHEKKSGVWKELYSCTAYVGRNGIDKQKEGDGKTPTGTFNLTQPFGISSDPGSNMEYTKVTKYHYWCGTSGSKYYNQLVDMRLIDRKNTSSDEYLIQYGSVYNYCMFIDYNKNGEANKGSCIFLHCTGSKKSTSGCIAVPEVVMKKIIQWAQPGAKIVIR